MMARFLGKLLRGVHAGDRHLLWNQVVAGPHEARLHLTSEAFSNGALIPARYAGPGVGANLSPPLSWSQAPEDTEELVLVIEDPDAPLPRPFVHLIVAGIPPSVSSFAEGELCAGALSHSVILGLTSFRQLGYSGPRALPGHGPHRYVFQLFALNKQSGLKPRATRRLLASALARKVLARGRLEGIFERQ